MRPRKRGYGVRPSTEKQFSRNRALDMQLNRVVTFVNDTTGQFRFGAKG
jgi:hypothetical protein